MGDFRGVFSVFQLGGIVFSVGEFAEGFVALFQPSSFGICAVLGRDSVFLEEGILGCFSELVHLLHGFWVWSEAVSTGSLPIFSSFQ